MFVQDCACGDKTIVSRHVNLRLREHLERWSYCEICRLRHCRRVIPLPERGRQTLEQRKGGKNERKQKHVEILHAKVDDNRLRYLNPEVQTEKPQ